jgi:hypothetical protein
MAEEIRRLSRSYRETHEENLSFSQDLTLASMNRDHYAAVAAPSRSPNGKLGPYPAIKTYPRASRRTPHTEPAQVSHTGHIRVAVRIPRREAGGRRPQEREEPVLVIDVWEERQRKPVAVHPQGSASQEDILLQAGVSTSVADHGIVEMLANDHSCHLMPVKLRREARDVARLRDRDVVVQKSDLVPTMQACQQESDIAFRA